MKFLWFAIFAALTASAQQQSATANLAYKPAALRNVGIDQKMGAQVPLDLPFVDSSGHDVKLGQYFGGKPVILALVYYSCPSLCTMILDGVSRSIKEISTLTAGKDFDVVVVSFNPRETPEMAADKRTVFLHQYKRPGAENGIHFLTGEEASSRMLADSVGYHYAYDSVSNQYAHPSAIMLLTPQGRVARYFYGIDYPVRDMRFGLEDASGGKISSPIDAVLLYCYCYNPANGKYGFVIMNAIRIAAGVTLVLLVGFMLIMFRRDFHAAHTRVG
ncbi:MAG TPA: SCO family protein [Bryobacteraceae bacterium]|jgi:protein SCO1|nr:SCO family protein [Bryobacteraceae bacterium]